MGLATLVKGPIGFLFPMAVMGLFLLCKTPTCKQELSGSRWRKALRRFGPVNFFGTIWRMRILTAIAVIVLVAGPWYLAVGLKTDGDFLQEFFGVHHFERFTTPMESHSGPFFYYIIALLVGMFPWSIFALPTLLLIIRQLRHGASHHQGLVFMTCWACVYVVIFSLASTKLPNYILPAYPALAVLAAYFYQYWIENPSKVHRAWPRIALSVLPLVGLLGMVGLPLAGFWHLDGQTLLDRLGLARDVQSHLVWTGLVGIPMVVGGVVALFLSEQGRVANAVACVGCTAVLTMLGLWNYAAPQIARYQINERVGEVIRRHAAMEDNSRIAHFGYFQPSLAFYIQQKVEACSDPLATHEFLEEPGPRLLITTSDWYDKLKVDLADDVEVVDLLDRFPEQGTIVILHKVSSSTKRTVMLPFRQQNTVNK